jgi:hypothetical protein
MENDSNLTFEDFEKLKIYARNQQSCQQDLLQTEVKRLIKYKFNFTILIGIH